ARGEQVADATEHVAAQRCRRPPPLRESLASGSDGAVHVLRVGAREQTYDVVRIRGVAVLEIFTGGGLHPLPADVVPELLRHLIISAARAAPAPSRASSRTRLYFSIFL